MQPNLEAKRRAMDAISHPETAAHKLAFQNGCAASPATAKASASMLGLAKQQAMSAIASVETLKQIGLVKLTGGVAVYLAHIRQVDRQPPLPRSYQKPIGRQIL